jgi:hypothetical protein
MAAERRAARLGEEFDESYPDTLAGRLEWLADHLRIDRHCFLRLMGLAPDEVEANLPTSWQTIADRWGSRALWVEQILSQLIALFGYDWRALADRLHQLAETGQQPEPGRVERLQTVPPSRREETLLALIGEGGPDVLTWLIEYLTQPARNGAMSEGRGYRVSGK